MNVYLWKIRRHVATLAAGLSMYTAKAWAVTIMAAAIGLVVSVLPTVIFDNPIL